MRKIILSAAAAVMALSTTASALEDIKVNGQAKLWYETHNMGNNDMFHKDSGSGEVVFKLGITGKQGNVGFGTTIYQTSTMGLEGTLVSTSRTASTNGGGATAIGPATTSNTSGSMYVGEAYITAPVAPSTVLKFGKQELDTPLAFTERWNAAPNTFNAAVAINSSINNLTLIGAYVGQDNATSFAVDGEVNNNYMGAGATTFAAAGLYKNDSLAVNVWAYSIATITKALWVDAGVKVAGVDLKAYAASMMPAADGADDTTALALSAATAVSGVKLFAAASMISDDGVLSVANTSTNFKKTKLPTAAVYLDGRSVAAPGATAIKVKAAGKVAGTGLALQAVMVSNDEYGVNTDLAPAAGDSATEIDLIVTKKIGDFNLKGLIMHRDFDAGDAQQHVRVIASVNF